MSSQKQKRKQKPDFPGRVRRHHWVPKVAPFFLFHAWIITGRNLDRNQQQCWIRTDYQCLDQERNFGDYPFKYKFTNTF